MSDRVMSERGQTLLELYPPAVRNDYTLEAICNVWADALDDLEEAVEQMQLLVIPATATDHLEIYEAMLRIIADTSSLSPAYRKLAITTFLARMAMFGTGAGWLDILNRLLGTGWTYSIDDPRQSVLTYATAFAPGSPEAQLAELLIRSVTPATMTINETATGAFLLDDSKLDEDQL
jgi:hypothetical protein